MLPTADVRSIYTGRRRSSECRPARSTALLTWLAKPSPALERKQPGQLRSTAPVRSRPDLRAKSVSGQDVQSCQGGHFQPDSDGVPADSNDQQPAHHHCQHESSQQLAEQQRHRDTCPECLNDSFLQSFCSEGPTAPDLLQQAAMAAAVSVLALSLCLSTPAAVTAAQSTQQQSIQQTQHMPRQHHVSSSVSAPSPWMLRQQQQQQLHQQAVPGGRTESESSQQQQQQLMFSLGSQVEDSMLEAVRQLEAGFDRAFGAFNSSVHMIDAAQARGEQAATDAAAQALIKEVWEVVDNSYMDARNSGFDHDKWAQLRDEALAKTYYDQASMHRAVKNMLAQGVSDPYCRFIPPADFQSMKKYDVTGVGLNLGTAEEYIKKTGRMLPTGSNTDGGVWVVGLSKGSEADGAGIEQGDQLLQVADTGLSNVTPFQAATLIAGPDDSSTESSVTLKVEKADGQVLDLTLQRPARYLPSPVSSSLQERGSGRLVGVIRLTSFNARALRDVSAALAELRQRGATELVLDLRDNRGGLVSEGLEVARLFLSDGVPIVLTQSKAMAADPPKAGASATTELPLIVLVNEHTASASEILAGALKDNCRGVLVGKRTYGKGLIQSVYELSDSSGLVITVGKYLTPRGVDIDRFGIAPDFGSLPGPDQAADTLNACKLEAGFASPALSTQMAAASSQARVL